MGKFDHIAGRAADMASEMGNKAAEFASDVGQRASHLGGNIKGKVPDAALKWVETGAALAMARTGTRAATKFVRRNPGLVAVAAVGAGLMWDAARRHAAKKAAEAPIEGSARRIEKTASAED